MARKALSKRLRFEIFKRDGFRCIYCGATAAAGPLQVDHIVPVANGGSDTPSNLATACQSCNGGKAAEPLERRRYTPDGDSRAVGEVATRICERLAAQRNLEAAREKQVAYLSALWYARFPDLIGSRRESQPVGAFFRGCVADFAVADLSEAVNIAANKRRDSALQAFRYLGGIVRRWRERGRATLAAATPGGT